MKFSHIVVATLAAATLAAAACSDPGPGVDPLLDAGADVINKPDAKPAADAGNRDSGADGAVVDSGPVQDFADAPVLSVIAPSSATVLSVGPSVVITGRNFVRRTVIQLEGAVLPTTYVSTTELRTTLPSARLTTAGRLRISVGTAPPGGGASAELMFDVVYAAPVLTSISAPSPPSVLVGAPDTNLVVMGTDFAANSTIAFDGADLPTTFVSATSLSTTIPTAKLGRTGSYPVVVKTPAPGGGTSSAISFTVANPTVQLTSISPSSVNAGAAATLITLDGAGFVAGSTVSVNGTDLVPTFVNSTRLTVTAPAAALLNVGNLPIAVTNPAPGGGVSLPKLLSVVYPAPTSATLAPATASTGDAPTEVTVTGTWFYPASQLTFNNAAAATTYVSATQLRATLTAAQLAAPGSIAVRVVNPMPGGGTTGPLTFQVSNASPTLATVVPAAAVFVGSGATLVTATGTRFLPTSVLRVNNTPLLTTYVSATQLTATVPASAFAAPSSLSFTVVNPAPGGGTSAAVTLAVGCDSTGVDIQLAALNMPQSAPTNFKVAGTTTSQMYYEARSCPATFAVLAADNSPIIRPYRAVVVQNTSAASATLAAWAVCSVDDDAYLTFYRRSTVPLTVADREVCTQYVAEGSLAPGGFSSPEAAGSQFCPGLTKANGGGISLNVCEKSVVYIQPFSITSVNFTPPTTFKVSLQ